MSFWLAALACLGLGLFGVLRANARRRDHRAGRVEAQRDAALKELAHAEARRHIDADVARLDNSAVADELRRSHTRD